MLLCGETVRSTARSTQAAWKPSALALPSRSGQKPFWMSSMQGEVNDMAKQGNEAAMEIMDDAKEYLANFIAILIAILRDPEIVILGGSVA